MTSSKMEIRRTARIPPITPPIKPPNVTQHNRNIAHHYSFVLYDQDCKQTTHDQLIYQPNLGYAFT